MNSTVYVVRVLAHPVYNVISVCTGDTHTYALNTGCSGTV